MGIPTHCSLSYKIVPLEVLRIRDPKDKGRFFILGKSVIGEELSAYGQAVGDEECIAINDPLNGISAPIALPRQAWVDLWQDEKVEVLVLTDTGWEEAFNVIDHPHSES